MTEILSQFLSLFVLESFKNLIKSNDSLFAEKGEKNIDTFKCAEKMCVQSQKVQGPRAPCLVPDEDPLY